MSIITIISIFDFVLVFFFLWRQTRSDRALRNLLDALDSKGHDQNYLQRVHDAVQAARKVVGR